MRMAPKRRASAAKLGPALDALERWQFACSPSTSNLIQDRWSHNLSLIWPLIAAYCSWRAAAKEPPSWPIILFQHSRPCTNGALLQRAVCLSVPLAATCTSLGQFAAVCSLADDKLELPAPNWPKWAKCPRTNTHTNTPMAWARASLWLRLQTGRS